MHGENLKPAIFLTIFLSFLIFCQKEEELSPEKEFYTPVLIYPVDTCIFYDTVTFIWHKVKESEKYILWIGGKPWNPIKKIPTASLSLDTVERDTFLKVSLFDYGRWAKIYWRVGSYYEISDTTLWSGLDSFYISIPPRLIYPSENFLLILNFCDSVRFEWENLGAPEYILQFSKDKSFKDIKENIYVKGKHWYIRKFSEPDSFYWRVKVKDEGKIRNPWSKERKIRITSVNRVSDYFLYSKDYASVYKCFWWTEQGWVPGGAYSDSGEQEIKVYAVSEENKTIKLNYPLPDIGEKFKYILKDTLWYISYFHKVKDPEGFEDSANFIIPTIPTSDTIQDGLFKLYIYYIGDTLVMKQEYKEILNFEPIFSQEVVSYRIKDEGLVVCKTYYHWQDAELIPYYYYDSSTVWILKYFY